MGKLQAKMEGVVIMIEEKTFVSILKSARKHEASDIHLMAGLPPAYRVNGEIIVSQWPPLTTKEMVDLVQHILTPEQFSELRSKRELCFPYHSEESGRSRLT